MTRNFEYIKLDNGVTIVICHVTLMSESTGTYHIAQYTQGELTHYYQTPCVDDMIQLKSYVRVFGMPEHYTATQKTA